MNTPSSRAGGTDRAASPEPDLNIAHRFLGILDQHGIYTFKTYDDFGDGRPGLRHVIRGPLDACAEMLIFLNKRGAAINVVINERDAMVDPFTVAQESLPGGNTVYVFKVDVDSSDKNWLIANLEPDIIVETGPRLLRACWFVQSRRGFHAVQTAIGLMGQCFPADHPQQYQPHIMRVPGFFHPKCDWFLTDFSYCNGLDPEAEFDAKVDDRSDRRGDDHEPQE